MAFVSIRLSKIKTSVEREAAQKRGNNAVHELLARRAMIRGYRFPATGEGNLSPA